MTPRDRESLERILACIEAVDAYVSRAGTDWSTDDMAVDAIAKRIEEIGEVAKRVTPATLETMPAVNWRGVKGIREVIVHDYEDVDIELLVGIVNDNLPGVRAVVIATLATA